MPTYDYKCKSCGHTWELFQSMTAKHEKVCPSCGKKTAERLIGTGAALLFKGSGFYLTDYRSEGYKKAAEADKKSSSGDGASSGKIETKASGDSTPSAKPAAEAPEVEKGSSRPGHKGEEGQGLTVAHHRAWHRPRRDLPRRGHAQRTPGPSARSTLHRR
ncbi:MAG: zinc ribbon domain-containing protein [Phycisphaerales bacterium]